MPFRTIDVTDADAVRAGIVETGPFDAIIHLAARKAIGESVAKPLEYYANNVGSTIVMLGAMAEHGIDTFLFSGTGTVYTHPEDLPFVESSRTGVDLPNPYSKSKKMCEEVMVDFSRTAPEKKLIRTPVLQPDRRARERSDRGGSAGHPEQPDAHRRARRRRILPQVSVFGRDYDDDGTALRDYIHVVDLAKGHLARSSMPSRGSPSSTSVPGGRPVCWS